ncbi:MAG: hypothetical protein ABIF12_01460, partial [bacterium]
FIFSYNINLNSMNFFPNLTDNDIEDNKPYINIDQFTQKLITPFVFFFDSKFEIIIDSIELIIKIESIRSISIPNIKKQLTWYCNKNSSEYDSNKKNFISKLKKNLSIILNKYKDIKLKELLFFLKNDLKLFIELRFLTNIMAALDGKAFFLEKLSTQKSKSYSEIETRLKKKLAKNCMCKFCDLLTNLTFIKSETQINYEYGIISILNDETLVYMRDLLISKNYNIDYSDNRYLIYTNYIDQCYEYINHLLKIIENVLKPTIHTNSIESTRKTKRRTKFKKAQSEKFLPIKKY